MKSRRVLVAHLCCDLTHLFSAEGKTLGTVCHFDSMPVRVTEEVATALDDLAASIAEAAFSTSEKE